MKKKILLSPPHMTGNEMKYIEEAFEQNWVAPLGPNVINFENQVEEYLGANNFCVALNSGTSAIHIALIQLNVKPDDYVICPSLTFVATANPILYLHARPIFIDSEPDTWNICPKALEQVLSQKKKEGQLPKAVITVDLFGRPCKYNEIVEICNHYNVPIIEDSAESLGSIYKNLKCGTIGKLGIFSFNGNKIITSSGGGMLVCHTQKEKDDCTNLITQARENAPYYLHSKLGYNYRLSNISAGIGRAQFEKIEEKVYKKNIINNLYRKELSNLNNIEFLKQMPETRENNWLTTISLKNTKKSVEEVINFLNEYNIESRFVWRPLHMQPLYKNCNIHKIQKEVVCENIFQNSLCLPSGTSLEEGDVSYICEVINKCLN